MKNPPQTTQSRSLSGADRPIRACNLVAFGFIVAEGEGLMATYSTKVKRDIRRWVEGGLIDAATGNILSADIDHRRSRGISFGTILAMMAAALLGAAVLLVVAANWEEFPRVLRVGSLFALILAGYVGGALFTLRDRTGFGEAAYVLGAVGFGAAIALIGQMYHMTGDEKQAIFVWGAGTAFAAAALRSPALTVGAVLLAAVWMSMHALGHWMMRGLPNNFLLVAAALFALSYWTRSLAARHLVLLSLYWFAILAYLRDDSINVPVLLAVLSGGLFLLGWKRPQHARMIGLRAGLPVQALLGFLCGVGTVQVALIDKSEFLLPTLAAFGGIVFAVLVAGRENALLRWLAYAAFVFQLCFTYIVMLGTMLGTAGFFVFGGAALAVLAWIIARLERRFGAPPSGPTFAEGSV